MVPPLQNITVASPMRTFFISRTITAVSQRFVPVVLLTALGHLILEVCQQFLPIVFPALIASLGLSYAQVGTLMLMSGVGSLSQPLFGYLSDRWSPQLIVVISIAWIGTLMGMVGFMENYWLLILVIGLGALGSGAFHPAGASLTTAAASKQRGAAMSIFSFSGTLGSALSPLLITLGIVWFGVRGTAIIIPIAIVTSLFILVQFRALSNLPGQHPASRSTATLSVAGSGSGLALALIVLMVAVRSWFQGTLMAYLPEWLQLNGYSLEVGATMLAMLLVTISIGSLIGGPLSDRVGRIPVAITSMTLLVPAHWLFLGASGVLHVLAVCLVGLMIGASFPVAIVMAQEAWPRSVGFASAMVMGLGWLPAGVGPWVTGMLADQTSLALGLHTLLYVPLPGIASTVCLILCARSTRRRGT